MMGYDWGMWGFGWIAMLLFWVVVLGGFVWLVLALSRQGDRPAPGETRRTAVQMLEERLARLEIDVQEFEDRKAAIQGKG